jgi:hypothetical protein
MVSRVYELWDCWWHTRHSIANTLCLPRRVVSGLLAGVAKPKRRR